MLAAVALLPLTVAVTKTARIACSDKLGIGSRVELARLVAEQSGSRT
jgi:hypothetical protein